MKSIYLYPITSRNNTGIKNPYIEILANELSRYYHVVNKDFPSNKGMLDLFNFLPKVDIIFLNWIEDLPDKKNGLSQTLIFFLFFFIIKLSRKKIIWTLHNKKSHFKKNIFIKNILFNLLLNHSNLILTHSKEGLKYIPQRISQLYLPHPIRSFNFNIYFNKKEYDIAIWGSINKYKGIDTFIKFLEKKGIIDGFKILISGKITDPELRDFFFSLKNKYNNLVIKDEFLEEKYLHSLLEKSKIILFTYHSDSILSSGALMDSIVHNSDIVGPRAGAFKDLFDMNLIYTFYNYEHLTEIINSILNGKPEDEVDFNKRKKFIAENSWKSFIDNLYAAIEEKLYSEKE